MINLDIPYSVISASVSEKDQRLSNNLRNYAIIQRQNGQADSALEKMLESAKACEGQDYANFVREHTAMIMQKVKEHDASQKKNSDFMKHYKLVNLIGSGVELD